MFRIGIDLGGTNIAAGVIDDVSMKLLSKVSCKTNASRPAEEIMEDMVRMALQAVQQAELSLQQIESVGIGCPGTCNRDSGVVEFANNLPFEQIPICHYIRRRLQLPVFLDNDANAAALGEFLAGGARGAESCVCVTLGTGVGGGIVLNGKLYSGHNFAGAELGHIVIIKDGEPCSCGRRGCWEQYASASALIRQTQDAMQRFPDSSMWSFAPELCSVSGRTAFDAMLAGDQAGKAVVQRYIEYIACGLVNVINIFQPEILCIGGGVCNQGETLLQPLRKYIEKERYSRYSQKQTMLTVAQLGNDAGIIGAALLGYV